MLLHWVWNEQMVLLHSNLFCMDLEEGYGGRDKCILSLVAKHSLLASKKKPFHWHRNIYFLIRTVALLEVIITTFASLSRKDYILIAAKKKTKQNKNTVFGWPKLIIEGAYCVWALRSNESQPMHTFKTLIAPLQDVHLIFNSTLFSPVNQNKEPE